MNKNGHRILLIGNRSPLFDGVSDLLQLAGYRVDESSSWLRVTGTTNGDQPKLAIVDTSSLPPANGALSERIERAAKQGRIPVLVLGFDGDPRMADLQRDLGRNGHPRIQFYTHSLLGGTGLLSKVDACLA